MKTNLTLILLSLALSACGSSDSTQPDEPTANANPTDAQPIITENADNPLSNPDAAPANSNASGVDSGTAKTYNNAYGPNFCDLETPSLDCWGDVNFNLAQHAEKLYMGQHAICYSLGGYGTGNMNVQCYSSSLGPITMIPKYMRGSPGSNDVETISNVTVNNSGQVCFKILQMSGTTVKAIYFPCGNEPTAQGGLQ